MLQNEDIQRQLVRRKKEQHLSVLFISKISLICYSFLSAYCMDLPATCVIEVNLVIRLY